MKFSKKAAFNFFIGILILGLVMQLIYSTIEEKPYNFNSIKLVVYAIFAAMYGFWKGKKEQKEVQH